MTMEIPTRIKGGGTWDDAAQAGGAAVVYDGLPEGSHTYLMLEVPEACPCAGRKNHHPAEPHDDVVIWIYPGDAIPAGDLADGSDRSRLVNDHIERGVAHLR